MSSSISRPESPVARTSAEVIQHHAEKQPQDVPLPPSRSSSRSSHIPLSSRASADAAEPSTRPPLRVSVPRVGGSAAPAASPSSSASSPTSSRSTGLPPKSDSHDAALKAAEDARAGLLEALGVDETELPRTLVPENTPLRSATEGAAVKGKEIEHLPSNPTPEQLKQLQAALEAAFADVAWSDDSSVSQEEVKLCDS